MLAYKVRRNYFWLFFTIFAAWITKLWLQNNQDILSAARVEFFPGTAILFFAFGIEIPRVVMAIVGQADKWA